MLRKLSLLRASLLFMGLSQGVILTAQGAPKIEYWQEPNGAYIYAMTVPHLPILDIQIDLDAGYRRDGKTGQSQALALMMGKGVRAITPYPAQGQDAMAGAWADLAAHWSVSAQADRWSFSVRSLNSPEVLESLAPLIAQQLAAPALSSAKWRQEQSKWLSRLEQAQTRPAYLAQVRLMRALYPQHPYGNTESTAHIQSMHVRDLQQWHQHHFRPCHMRISVVSALPAPALRKWIQTILRTLPQTCTVLPAIPLVDAMEKKLHAQNLHHAFPSEQSHILLGTRAIARSDPDFFPLLVGNQILGGGGFASLLTQRVREQEGLSYSVQSYFSPMRDRGYFVIGLETRADQAEKATRIARATLEDFLRTGPQEQALQQAQAHLIESFPARLDSNAKLLGMLSNIAWNDLPLDYLETWTQKIQAVNAREIQSAFARAVDANAFVEVRVGPNTAASPLTPPHSR